MICIRLNLDENLSKINIIKVPDCVLCKMFTFLFDFCFVMYELV